MNSFFFLFVTFCLISCCIESKRAECCQSSFTGLGFGCQQSDVTFNNKTYTCSKVQQSCQYCKLAHNISSSSCSSCCTIQPQTCVSSTPVSTVSSTSWVLIIVVFTVSICCCCIVFLSAEQSRTKEGISFEEAYLLPIPIVTVDLDLDNKDLKDEIDAVATAESTINIPVAEPTENRPLISRLNGDRIPAWNDT